MRSNSAATFLLKPLCLVISALVTVSIQAAPQVNMPSKAPALVPQMMDIKVNPCEDFFSYANGQWLANTPLPANQSRTGAFNELRETNWARLIQLASTASTDKKGDALSANVGAFYASWMDQQRIETAGLKPLQAWRDQIDAATTPKDIVKLLGSASARMPSYSWRGGVAPAMQWYVSPDAVDSTRNLLHFAESGLGLPDREDYFPKNEAETAKLKAYEQLLSQIFTLAGFKDPATEVRNVLQIETALAKATRDRVQARDPNLNYNAMSLEQLQKTAPGIDWTAFFAAMKVTPPAKFNLRNPGYATALADGVEKMSPAAWRSYLHWQLLSAWADYLPQAYGDAMFNYYSTTLQGVKKQRDRDRRGIEKLDLEIGFELGKLYVAQHFDSVAKQRMDQMISNLKTAFSERLEQLDWMSAPTKAAAQAKLKAIDWKIGYPGRWPDYGFGRFSATDLVGNVSAAARAKIAYDIKQIGQAPDPYQWAMTPSTVNAYANPPRTEIVFPAGILQAPLFNADADDAVNYGAIGMVIGHELTHHFDDQGRKYDAQGNLRDWWSAEDAQAFNRKLERIQTLYSSYQPLPGFYINGKLTSGENIADFGGLSIAYDAFKKTEQFKSNQLIDQLTPTQRFYLGYAQGWRFKATDGAIQQQLRTDPHSPAKYRVNGPVSQSDTFAKAFSCKAPATEAITIW